YGYTETTVDIGGKKADVAFERLILSFRAAPFSDNRICAYFGIIQNIQPDILGLQPTKGLSVNSHPLVG
ncbi:MAG: hypothetical protein ABJP82_20705, partial [Hyphomicrobiales bacterium]